MEQLGYGARNMTVGQLVRVLESYPQDMRVVVDGYEGGYDDLSLGQVSLVRIALNTGKHEWEGKHGDPDGPTGRAPDNTDTIEALVLRRVSN